MRRFSSILLLPALLWLTLPGYSWNATGHRVIGAIAYDHLNPQAKARVDALLKQHPDFSRLPSRAAFLEAAVWPDNIRNDPRFYEDTAERPKPTRQLPGFPDMGRHTNWHYVDIPFSLDGTPLEPAKSPNALMELRRILRENNMPAYDLPWLIHLAGDVHQPLHDTSLFVKSLPHGDQGGNLFFIMPGRNLHALWDGMPGTDTSEATIDRLAVKILEEFEQAPGRHRSLSKDPKVWVDEGFDLAKKNVYTLGPDPGTRQAPVHLPEGYESRAHAVARVQMAKAGLRLADALNAKMGH